MKKTPRYSQKKKIAGRASLGACDNSLQNFSRNFICFFAYILPLILCFSYYPLIKLGENETMYFELSLPLIWLVMFDLVAFVLIIRKYRKKIFTKIFGSVFLWLFLLFATFSVFWSLNPFRGILTVGVMWLLFFAVLFFYDFREYFDERFFKVFWRWFFGSALFVSVWCFVQCVLDLVGVSQDNSLLCNGCIYQMFGFPHPNGFAIEPQFMGNLLLAPIIAASYFYIKTKDKKYLMLLFVTMAALFLTFSRGAIYACVVGLVFMDFFVWVRVKKFERKAVCGSIMKIVGVGLISFVFTLNLQGTFAAISPTSEGYFDGVARVLNHLSLGIIDVRGGEESESSKAGELGKMEVDKSGKIEKNGSEKERAGESNADVVENSGLTEGNIEKMPVQNSDTSNGNEINGTRDDNNGGDDIVGGGNDNNDGGNSDGSKAVFDGYVAESTDTRVRLTSAALSIWRQTPANLLVGVGIGGAGQALYNNGLSPAPREIVQNEYASLLLEIGLIGFLLFVVMMIIIVKIILKTKVPGLILALLVAYGVSLCFFSGLTNALQIVLIPGVLIWVDAFSNKGKITEEN